MTLDTHFLPSPTEDLELMAIGFGLCESDSVKFHPYGYIYELVSHRGVVSCCFPEPCQPISLFNVFFFKPHAFQEIP